MNLRVFLSFLLINVRSAYDHSHDSDLRAGESLNIFSGYGYLHMDLHVLPTNDTEPWLITEETHDVFGDRPMFNSSLRHEGDFHLEFCDTPQKLMRAYFRNFTIEGLPRPWRAFTSSWDRASLARRMGIPESFVSSKYGYVLVRFVMKKTIGWMDMPEPSERHPKLIKAATKKAASVVPGDEASVESFIAKFGTHYISSFATGELIYQVFVYETRRYYKIQEMRLENKVTEWKDGDLDFVFSPVFADHTGRIQVTSGNEEVKEWVRKKLDYFYFTYSYENLLMLHKHDHLKRAISDLVDDEVLLQLDLKILSPAFHQNETRRWFEEILRNRLMLWDSAM